MALIPSRLLRLFRGSRFSPTARRIARRQLLAVERLECRLPFSAGDLDVSWDGDGIVESGTVKTFRSTDEFAAAEVDSAGRIVAMADSNPHLTVARFLDDGTLDPTFGTNGVAKLMLSHHGQKMYDLAIQADGRILLAGNIYGPGFESTFAVARLNTDGSLDQTFGTGGISTAGFLGHTFAQAIAIGPDGRIHFVGNVVNDVIMGRLLPTGERDGSFALGGVTNFDFLEDEQPHDIAVLSDGTAVVAMTHKRKTDQFDAIVYHVFLDGTIDTSFGQQGTAALPVVLNDASSRGDRAVRLEVTEQNKILIGATQRVAGAYQVVVAQFDATGKVDSDFGNSGVIKTPFTGGWSTNFQGIEQGRDGTILISGTFDQGTFIPRYFVARYLEDGSVDRSFADEGVFHPVLSLQFSQTYQLGDVVERPDGSIIGLASASQTPESNVDIVDIALLGLTANGDWDTSFSEDGLQVVNLVEDQFVTARTEAVTTLADGRVLAVVVEDAKFFLYRYRADGEPDESYGPSGRRQISGTPSFASAAINPQFSESNGTLYVVVSLTKSSSGRPYLAIGRLTSAGEIDTAFGGHGWLELEFSETNFAIHAVGLVAEGGFYVARTLSPVQGNTHYAITKYAADGGVNSSFGDAGTVRIPKNADQLSDGVQFCSQPDGKLVVLASNLVGQSFRISVQRYFADGKQDLEFGDRGTALTSLTGAKFARHVLCGADGKIIAVGTNREGFQIERFDASGKLDEQFSNDGRLAVVGQDWKYSFPYASMLDERNRVVIAAEVSHDNYFQYDWGVVRITETGELDSSFAEDGVLLADVHGRVELVSDMSFTPTGDILIAGEAYTLLDRFAAIARIEGDGGVSAFQRQPVAEDVNGDESITPLDVLAIVNDLNAHGSRKLPAEFHEGLPIAKLDVNGDQWVSAVDALIVINWLNSRSADAESAGNSDSRQSDSSPVNYFSLTQQTHSTDSPSDLQTTRRKNRSRA